MGDKRFLSDDLELLEDLVLIPEKRKKVSEIRGDLMYDPDVLISKDVVCVGDRVTRVLLEAGMRPRVVVIDLKEKREVNPSAAYLLDGFLILTARNPPGRLTREAWMKFARAVEVSSKVNVAVLIDGEEDLLGFPAMILSPNDWIFVYGQPDIGMVMVRVTENSRREAIELLEDAFTSVNSSVSDP
ncbi:MAG: GTP-dependent dephospho-CoA kinase family protein [Candidatus Korarchaeum sp.]